MSDTADLAYRPAKQKNGPSRLLNAVQDLILPFIRSADEDAQAKESNKTNHGLAVKGGGPRTVLVEHHKPQKLEQLMDLDLPETGSGHEGFLKQVEQILQYSVNTWDRGFLCKLYASTDAPGLAAELILATLNTNVHIYDASPALTLIEKNVTKALANLFGLTGPHAGGISVQGGSMSNNTSIVIARNTLHPKTKDHGISTHSRKLLLFTSAHGHYSIERAAQMLGFGTDAIRSIPVEPHSGSVDLNLLEEHLTRESEQGNIPFYLNATSGTTVLGSYDPLAALVKTCQQHNMWLHVDASWGGPAIFSPTHAHKLKGSHLANSIAINPHKMMGVPLTCSFLLGADMRQFQKSNTMPADYLFHNDTEDGATAGIGGGETYDLADLTLQCGRRGDALKLHLAWIYHGSSGFAEQIDNAFSTAAYLAQLVSDHPDMALVSENPPPCTQVCFFYAKERKLKDGEGNGKITRGIKGKLVRMGWMVDYAKIDERGYFLRVVVNRGSTKALVEGLIGAVEEVGKGVWEDEERT